MPLIIFTSIFLTVNQGYMYFEAIVKTVYYSPEKKNETNFERKHFCRGEKTCLPPPPPLSVCGGGASCPLALPPPFRRNCHAVQRQLAKIRLEFSLELMGTVNDVPLKPDSMVRRIVI